MTTSQILIMIAIASYLGLVLIIGIIFSKKNKNVDDFYLGGRKLGPLVTAMSAEASDMSGWLLMGLPGVAYLTGVADAAWTAIGLAVGTYLNWLIVAKKLRIYSKKIDAITIPDFFAKRYGDSKNIITLIAAVIIIVFFVAYTASGFAACGKLFSSIFNVDYLPAMVISAAVIVIYCTLGGFLAASTTDLIQSIVMTIALFVIVGFGVSVAGGFDAVANNIGSLAGYISLNATHSLKTGESNPYNMLTICSTLAWGLGYFGMPHILLRFMAIKDEKKLKTSRRIASVWVVISLAVSIFIGIMGLAMTRLGKLDDLTASSSAAETVIICIAKLLSQHGAIAALIAGVILAGILAATMSTADSQLLTAASGVSQNILHDFFKIKVSEKVAVLIARIVVVIVSVIAVIIALDPNSSVFEIVAFAWAGFGATFGPVMLFALFWRRSNKYGAVAGMVTGGVMVFLWKFVIAKLGGVFAIYELLPAFILACVVNVIVSLVTATPDKQITDTFDKVKKLVKK